MTQETARIRVMTEPLRDEGESDAPPVILIVDEADINRRVLRAMLKTSFCRILECSRPAKAFEILATENVDLIIVDLMLPDMGGPEFCRRLKSERPTRFIPVIM